jgi:hypothetical protein
MGHVMDAGGNVNERFELGMTRHLFRRLAADVDLVAKELGVRYGLEGSAWLGQ